jgi:hypothetical protein
MLEEAVTGGQLVPGARGWKARQQRLTQAHRDTPRDELAGQSLAQVILTERIQIWLDVRRSETRKRTLAVVANRLLHPAQLAPDDALHIRRTLASPAALPVRGSRLQRRS